MNWGTKLIIGMLSFMSFIVVLGILMITSESDALVEKEYYEKGLNYDQDYARKEKVSQDNATPKISITAEQLDICFKKKSEGSVKLLRSSDSRMDRVFPFQTDSLNCIKVPSKQLARGFWKIIINWSSNGSDYLYEQEVRLNE